MMHEETVAVEQLEVWKENPRIEPAASESEAMRRIYEASDDKPEKSRRQFMNLVESIAVNGYQNLVEPILVLESGDHYIVQDANRRITALKMLNYPNRFSNILTVSDKTRLETFVKESQGTIDRDLNVVVFDDTKEDKESLKAILQRLHNGPQDGVGTVSWTTEAKQRFTGKETFSDKLEGPFCDQFNQTLSDYFGGNSSITTVHRLINAKPARDYLGIDDPENPTTEQLDKVRSLVDTIKDYAQSRGIPASRINVATLNSEIITHLSEQPPSAEEPDIPENGAGIDVSNFKLSVDSPLRRVENHIGAKWNNSVSNMIVEDRFEQINVLLMAYEKYGKLTGDQTDRIQKLSLCCPSIRVLFELGIRVVMDNAGLLTNIDMKGWTSSSTSHGDHVRVILQAIRQDKTFLTYLSSHGVFGLGFKKLQTILRPEAVVASVDKSEDTAHTSNMNMSRDDLMPMFNDAVLFAYLCEQYIVYKEKKSSTTAGQI